MTTSSSLAPTPWYESPIAREINVEPTPVLPSIALPAVLRYGRRRRLPTTALPTPLLHRPTQTPPSALRFDIAITTHTQHLPRFAPARPCLRRTSLPHSATSKPLKCGQTKSKVPRSPRLCPLPHSLAHIPDIDIDIDSPSSHRSTATHCNSPPRHPPLNHPPILRLSPVDFSLKIIIASASGAAVLPQINTNTNQVHNRRPINASVRSVVFTYTRQPPPATRPDPTLCLHATPTLPGYSIPAPDYHTSTTRPFYVTCRMSPSPSRSSSSRNGTLPSQVDPHCPQAPRPFPNVISPPSSFIPQMTPIQIRIRIRIRRGVVFTYTQQPLPLSSPAPSFQNSIIRRFSFLNPHLHHPLFYVPLSESSSDPLPLPSSSAFFFPFLA
ncbi:hypothetical protein R3P38DRAFT_3295034 [Favolaschia claudopus]|uniref:Uncharacterized protein n=1 Tax=Favolaschia claudopus TaxID=2862362 RepID=A0AAV9ZCZ7_9AGAR